MTGRIGRLRHRLVLESVERTPDGGGGATKTWIEEATVWADLRPLGGSESVVADHLSGRLSHEIVIRYRDGVTPAMRFRQDTRIFKISAVLDLEERHAFLRCLCTEENL